MGMSDEALGQWVQAWGARYALAEDDVLEAMHGAPSLDKDAVLALVEWKFNAMAHRRANARRRVAQERDQAVIDVTAAARGCVDDGAALRVVTVLRGVGPALGSALLMAMAPARWTVLDVRALASVRVVGYGSVPADAQHPGTWLPYLLACRDLQARTQESLRTVDRALFAAKGQRDLPTA